MNALYAHPRRRLGLAVKVSLLVAGGVITAIAGSAFLLLSREHRQAERDLEARALAIGELIAGSSEYAIYTGSTDALTPLLSRLDAMEDVAYFRVLRASSEVVFDRRFDAAFRNRKLPGVGAVALSRTSSVARALTMGPDNVLDVVVPVLPAADGGLAADPMSVGTRTAAADGPLGVVQLGVTLRPSELRQEEALLQVALSALVLLTAILALSAWLIRRVTAPVGALVRAAEATGEGRFEPLGSIDARDEIGTLARAFDQMQSKLRASWAELEEHQRTLEEKVASRTLALEEARAAAEEHAARAEHASRAKSQFLANMSHEIRTPMNGVMGMLELLSATPLNSRQQRFAETAYRSAEELLELINDVLDFSKIEAGHLELHGIDFDLRQSVEDVCEMLAPRAHQKGIDLIVRIAPQLHRSVHGDVMRLRQVLVNLIGNAIKFTQKGSVQVRVTVCSKDADRQEIRFEVQDSGIGIAPDVAARLFQPFVQADSSTTREFGGTGLGLAIGRQLVSLMGGEITLTSEVGVGSTFGFTVPLDVRASDTFAPLSAESALKGRRILVIDDNETNREVLREQLGAWGAHVDEAAGGAAGLAALGNAEAYDLMILDFTMPLMDGGEVARVVRANPDWSSLPILLLSSVGGTAQAQESAAPVDAMLTKPVRQRELAERISALVQGSVEVRTGDAASSARRRPRPSTDAPQPLDGVRILLAEDNPVNQLVASGFLEAAGCTVVIAGDGVQAVTHAASSAFDLILMDCMMPELDGYGATQRIRAAASTDARRVPIIALTASALDGEQQRCLEAGMDDYLSKPVRQDALMAMIERWCRRVPDAGTSSPPAETIAAPDSTAAPSFDRAAIDAILGCPGGTRIVARSVEAYGTTAPEQLTELCVAVASESRDNVRRIAHTLKSSSAMLGLKPLAEILRRMELEAMDLDLAELENLAAQARVSLEQGIHDLVAYAAH